MRYPDTNPEHSAEIGSRRFRSGFLWLPRCINGELRWLEHATWVERFQYDWNCWQLWGEWVAIRWHNQ